MVGTDRIALMQERLAARLADRMDLRVMECPGRTEPIVEALWWHRQYEDDIAHAWLRRLIMEAARGLDRPPARPGADQAVCPAGPGRAPDGQRPGWRPGAGLSAAFIPNR